METLSPKICSVVELGGGIFVSPELFETLTEIVGEDRRRDAQEKERLSRSEIETRFGLRYAEIRDALAKVRRIDEKIQRYNDWAREESDKAFRPPSASLKPAHRKANGHVDWDQIRDPRPARAVA